MANVDLDYNERDMLDDLLTDYQDGLRSGNISVGTLEQRNEMIEIAESARMKLAAVASVND